MKFKLTAACILLSAVIFTGCEKDNDDDDNTPKTKTELISASVWKYDKAEIDADNNGVGDMAVPAGVIDACHTDNLLTFSANGNGTMDEGADKCGADQTSQFTWTLTNNETVLNVNTPVLAGVGGEFKIISLTETELKLSKAITVPIPTTIIVSFKH